MAVLLRLRFCCGGHLTFGFCLCGPPYLLISSLQLIFGRTLVHRDGVVLVLKRNSSITFVGSWRLGPRSAIRDP
jgi:hypothetical protein